MSINPSLVLASASPRRKQIMSQLALPFTVSVSPSNEDIIQQHYAGPATGLAQWLAAHKALSMLAHPEEISNKLIITADTTVILDNQILGKPRDENHARELLLTLRGRWHQVVTGVVVSALIDGELHMRGGICTTSVLMRPYTEREVDDYIATGDPLDKAGAYGIQHPDFQPTERIDGCYFNVVGLPLCLLTDLLIEFQIYPATAGRSCEQICHWKK